jgi:hypothetical protein
MHRGSVHLRKPLNTQTCARSSEEGVVFDGTQPKSYRYVHFCVIKEAMSIGAEPQEVEVPG